MASVETVRGPVELGNLGQTLMHEHIFVLSTEHVQNYGSRWWDEEARVADAIAKLNSLYAKGIHTAAVRTCTASRSRMPWPGPPGVYEAAVLGVPDEMMGEKVGAVIVPTPGVKFAVEAVFDYLVAHIADFKIPQYVAVSAAPLPRNPGGKLLKRQLRDTTDWTAAIRP